MLLHCSITLWSTNSPTRSPEISHILQPIGTKSPQMIRIKPRKLLLNSTQDISGRIAMLFETRQPTLLLGGRMLTLGHTLRWVSSFSLTRRRSTRTVHWSKTPIMISTLVARAFPSLSTALGHLPVSGKRIHSPRFLPTQRF